MGLGSDALWQGDLDRGLPGYLYCFSKSVEGITSVPDGVVAEETVDSYVPPFQVETISILISDDGFRSPSTTLPVSKSTAILLCAHTRTWLSRIRVSLMASPDSPFVKDGRVLSSTTSFLAPFPESACSLSWACLS